MRGRLPDSSALARAQVRRWADARVLIACRLEPADAAPDLDALAEALRRPERPLFLGRKPFLPSRPLLLGEVEADTIPDPWRLFHDILGWPADRVAGAPGGPAMPDTLRIAFPEQDTLLEPHGVVLTNDGAPQLLVRIEDVILDRRATLDGWEATAQQRFERLLRETGILAGVLIGLRETGRHDAPTERVLRLVVAPRGEVSGHMSWPLDALASVGGRAMLAGLKLLLDAHALFTGPPSHRLPALLAESRAAQADVSARLAGQVLASLHELLRGLDAAGRARPADRSRPAAARAVRKAGASDCRAALDGRRGSAARPERGDAADRQPQAPLRPMGIAAGGVRATLAVDGSPPSPTHNSGSCPG